MATFGVQLFFPVDDPVACAEILSGDEVVASVYERPDGWQIDLYQSPRGLDLDGFLRAVASAKERLAEYPNRRGESPPEGLSAAGLSLWLTEKADGTTLADRVGQRSDAEQGVTPDRGGKQTFRESTSHQPPRPVSWSFGGRGRTDERAVSELRCSGRRTP